MDRAKRRVREVTGWSDPVEEKTSFVEAACLNYEVLVEDKRVGKVGWVVPLGRYDTRSGPRRGEGIVLKEKAKQNILSF